MLKQMGLLSACVAIMAGCNSMDSVGGQSSNSLSATDNQFIQNAGVGGMFEVRSSEIALNASTDPQIKTFAQQMITDHGKANQQLMSLAQSKGALPPAQLDSKHQLMLDALQKEKGSDFDKVFVQDQVAAHDEAVALFKSEASTGVDTDLKQFASKTLPTLEAHQKHIYQITKDKSGGM